MKTKTLFFSSLVAAAAMSTVPAFAEDKAYTTSETISENLTVDGKISVNAGATVTQTAGTVSATRLVLKDASGSAGCSYVLNGGVLNVSGSGDQTSSTDTTQNAILLGHWTNGTSKLTVSGGVLNATNGVTVISWDSAGTLEISGGEANLYGITLNPHRANAATLTLSGGRLNLGSYGLAYGGSATNKTVTLSGCTLGALEDWSSSVAMTVNGNVTIDTTKWVPSDSGTGDYATGDNTGATITLSGNITQTADTTLTVSGAGTLDLAGTITLSSAIFNSGTVKVSSSSAFVLAEALKNTGTDNTYTLITNTDSGNITDWSKLTISNFRYANGTTFTGRSLVDVTTDGKVTVTEVAAANLVWNGSVSSTWDTTTKNWTNGSATDKFYSKDNVTFSAGQNATVTFSENLTAGKVSIAGNVTLADTITGTLTGEIVVADGGTLTVSQGSTSGESAIRGSLTIQSGGKASFTAGDVCGWSGTASSRLDALTVDSGGTLEINRNGNETFRGTLTLNGTLTSGTSGGSSTMWDLHGGSAKIVTTAAGAKIDSGVNLRFRQNNSEINVGSDASLEIASVISKSPDTWGEGNGSLRKTGAGTLTLSGANTYSGETNIEAGTVVAKNASALGTGNISISADAELKLDIGSDTTMTQGSGTISGANNQNVKLTIASGKLVLTSASNNFKGTVDILDGGTLELNSGAKLQTEYANQSTIWVRSGGELRMTSFDYNALGGSPDYAERRKIDGGRISITGETSSSGQGFTVTSNGGEFLMEQSGQTLTLEGNGNSNIIALNGALKIGGAGDIVINKNSAQVAIIGNGSLEKVGAGTLTINSAGNTYTGGTTVTQGKLIVGSSNALGTADRSVRIAGGQLEIGADVTLVQTNIEIALSDAYSSVAAILGEGALADSTTITLTAADKAMVASLVEKTKEYQIFASDTSLASNFSVNSFSLDEEAWADWKISGYDATTGKVTLEMIPEPSAFGLLAGVGALVFVAARRRRRAK